MGKNLGRNRLAYGGAFLILLSTGAIWIWQIRYAPGPRQIPYLGVAPQRQRIDVMIAKLSSESFHENVNRLTDDQDYFYPGYPDVRKADQVNLEWMLSNRRCIKLLNDLEKLPGAERDRQCRRIFELFFQRHTDAYAAGLRHALDASSPKNTQSLLGTQLALCTVMVASAKYANPSTLQAQFESLDAFQTRLEGQLAERKGRYEASLLLVARRYCVPDNRAQLNILFWYGLALNDQRVSEGLKKICAHLPKSEIPIVAWNAHTTWFDIPHRLEGVPLDRSKGVADYVFYGWPDTMYLKTDLQNELLREVRKTVFFGS